MNLYYLLNNKFLRFFIAFVKAKGSQEPVPVKYSSTFDSNSGEDPNKKVDFFVDFSTLKVCPFILR